MSNKGSRMGQASPDTGQVVQQQDARSEVAAIQEHQQQGGKGAYRDMSESDMQAARDATQEDQLPYGALHKAPIPANTCGCCPDLEAPPALGPFLRFAGFDSDSNSWNGSALFVCTSDVAEEPTLHYTLAPAAQSHAASSNDVTSSSRSKGAGSETEVRGQLLDSYGPWKFWRFQLNFPVTEEEQVVTYRMGVNPQWLQGTAGSTSSSSSRNGAASSAAAAEVAAEPAGVEAALNGRRHGSSSPGGRLERPPLSHLKFYIPGLHQTWRWGFYSCAGFSNDVPLDDQKDKWGGFDYLWRDVLDCHGRAPLHLMVGGGDQLYSDDVFTTPAMADWLAHPVKEERFTMRFKKDQAVQATAYYFHHYACHWASPAVAAGYRSIPQAMTWDDHDLMDGWGSYPSTVQQSPVFQGLYIIMRRFYLLFQQHTTPELAHTHGLYGGSSYSQLLQLGPRVALAMPDQRAERTVHQICSISTYMDLFTRICALPDSVNHLVLVATVPIVYPHMTTSQRLLNGFRAAADALAPLYRLFKAMGLTHAVYSKFDEPELLDDLRDHWSSPPHKEERRFLIEQLQMIAKARSMRVTFISGDVHLAAAARLYTWPKMDAPDVKQQQEAPARHTLNLHPLRSQNLSREDAVVVGEVVGTPEWEHLEGGRVGDGSDAGSDTGVSPGGGYGRGTSSVRSGWAASTAGATVGASSRQESLDSEAGASSSSSSAAGRVGAAPAAGFGVAGARGAAAGRLTHSGRHSGATRAQDDASSSVSSASTAPDQKWHRRWSGFGRRMGSPGRGRHGWGGLLRDHRFMTQVVSSAIVNAPPPDILVKVLIAIGHAGFTNNHTRNKMVRVFEDHTRRKRLLNMRNWVLVTQLPDEGMHDGNSDMPGVGAGAGTLGLQEGHPGQQQHHHQHHWPWQHQAHTQTHPGHPPAVLLDSSAAVEQVLAANDQPMATAAAAAEARTAAALGQVAAMAGAAGVTNDTVGSTGGLATRAAATGLQPVAEGVQEVQLQPAVMALQGRPAVAAPSSSSPFAAAVHQQVLPVPGGVRVPAGGAVGGGGNPVALAQQRRGSSTGLGSGRTGSTALRPAFTAERLKLRHRLMPLTLQQVLGLGHERGGGRDAGRLRGSLVFEYRVQDTHKPPPHGQVVKTYDLLVPPLFVD